MTTLRTTGKRATRMSLLGRFDCLRRNAQNTVLIALLLALFGCASSVQQGSHCSVEEGFLATQDSYRWRGGEAIRVVDDTGYISPAIAAELEAATVAELRSKGFVLNEQVPGQISEGLELQLTLRVRREIDSTNVYGEELSACHEPFCLHSPTDPGVRFLTRTVGFLAADAYFDGKPIWRGWVERNLHPSERDNAGQVIGLALPLLLKDFPP